MSTVNHEAASSALYHIEAMERRLKLMKQYINPQAGVANDAQVVRGLAQGIEDELTDLHNDLMALL